MPDRKSRHALALSAFAATERLAESALDQKAHWRDLVRAERQAALRALARRAIDRRRWDEAARLWHQATAAHSTARPDARVIIAASQTENTICAALRKSASQC